MKTFIQNVLSETLLWKAIDLLHKNKMEVEFLKTYLKRTLNSGGKSLDTRFRAANYLMEMNDVIGLIFCADYI